MNCGRQLAPGQWWHTCGETDMGQTMPVQCEECEPGGLRLATPVADEPTAQSDATERAGVLTVRKLRRILDGLDAGMTVVLEGTEWNMRAGGAEVRPWHETHEDGRPTGHSETVLFIQLRD